MLEKRDFGQISFQLICGLSSVGHHRATSKQNTADGGRKERTIPLGSMIHISCHTYIKVVIFGVSSNLHPLFVPKKCRWERDVWRGFSSGFLLTAETGSGLQITSMYMENVTEANGIT